MWADFKGLSKAGLVGIFSGRTPEEGLCVGELCEVYVAGIPPLDQLGEGVVL